MIRPRLKLAQRFSREFLAPIVAEETSVSKIVKRLGIRYSGGAYAAMKRLIQGYGIDTSHFVMRAGNFGVNHKGGFKRRIASEVLVFSESFRIERTHRIRRAMLEIGRTEECEECGLGKVWNGRPYKLQIDHKNGVKWDNRPENVRFMCHNCHSQTPTFGTKNRGRGRPKK